MFSNELLTTVPLAMKSFSNDRDNLVEMSRTLRRAKRLLFLAAASQPTEPVDQLRQIFHQISVDCMLKDESSEDDETLASNHRSGSADYRE
jgi:hypothetical protein